MQERESKQDTGKREEKRGQSERDLDAFPRKREASDFGTHGGSHRGTPRQEGERPEPGKSG